MTPSASKPYLDEFEKARITFRLCGLEEQFPAMFSYFFSAPPEDRAYVFKGPTYMGWFRHLSPPEFDTPDESWAIFYLSISSGMTILDAFNMLPYRLPYIGFARGIRGRNVLKFHRTEVIEKKCKMFSLSSFPSVG